MRANKVLIISIVVSLLIHVVVLSLAGLVDMRSYNTKEEILTISLAAIPSTPDKKMEEKRKEIQPPEPQHNEENNPGETKQEDTIELTSRDKKYSKYLLKIREKIETIWVYPHIALQREEEGTTVVRFSIHKSGSLTESTVISTSGSQHLDEGALHVIRNAAPFDPFPIEFDLTQLNIIARFEYKLVDH